MDEPPGEIRMRVPALSRQQGNDDMHALPSSEHRKTDQADVRKLFLHFARRASDLRKLQSLVRIEIEDHPVGPFDVIRVARPGMKFDRAHLHAIEQPFAAVEIDSRPNEMRANSFRSHDEIYPARADQLRRGCGS